MAVKNVLKEKRYCSRCKKHVKVSPSVFGQNSPKCPRCGAVLISVENINFIVEGSTGAGQSPRKYNKES